MKKLCSLHTVQSNYIFKENSYVGLCLVCFWKQANIMSLRTGWVFSGISGWSPSSRIFMSAVPMSNLLCGFWRVSTYVFNQRWLLLTFVKYLKANDAKTPDVTLFTVLTRENCFWRLTQIQQFVKRNLHTIHFTVKKSQTKLKESIKYQVQL